MAVAVLWRARLAREPQLSPSRGSRHFGFNYLSHRPALTPTATARVLTKHP